MKEGGSVSAPKKLFLREYDALISDAELEIRRLEREPSNPDIEGAILSLRKRIRQLKSEKLGIELPASANSSSDGTKPNIRNVGTFNEWGANDYANVGKI